MAEPIQSRCVLKRLAPPPNITWRQNIIAKTWGHQGDAKVPVLEKPKSLDALRDARLQGADPYAVMLQLAKGHPLEREALKRSTMGMSPWILSAWIISNASEN